MSQIQIVKHDSGTDCGQPYASWMICLNGVEVGMMHADYQDADWGHTSSRSARWKIAGYGVEFFEESPFPDDELTVQARECEVAVPRDRSAAPYRKECVERIRRRLAPYVDAEG